MTAPPAAYPATISTAMKKIADLNLAELFNRKLVKMAIKSNAILPALAVGSEHGMFLASNFDGETLAGIGDVEIMYCTDTTGLVIVFTRRRDGARLSIRLPDHLLVSSDLKGFTLDLKTRAKVILFVG